MRQGLKYSAYGVAGLLSLIAIATAVLITTFNPNDYKPQLIELVQAKKNRTLKLDADKYLGAKSSGASQGFNLETLKALNVDGSVRIGQLKYVEAKATKVLIHLKSSTTNPHV